MPPLDNRKGLVLNKSAVARLELPVAHTFTFVTEGWRIDFTGSAEIRVVGTTGANDLFTVAAGDFMLATAHDYYVSRVNAGGGA